MTQASTAIPVNGPVLRELRKRAGLSIGDLAEAVGKDRSWITKIEVSARDVSPELFDQLLRTLRIQDPRVLMRTDGADR